RVQVHHRRQVQPALVGADVGDVGDPDLVRRVRSEVAVQHIVDHADRATPMAGLAPVADLRAQPFGLHQPLYAVAAAGLARFAQVQRDLAVAVHASTGQPGVLDQAQQPLILALAQAGRLPNPGVVAAPVHAEHPAHRDQSELADMRAHERVLRPYPLAKYAAAFFRMSRSSVTRRSSALRRRISAESVPAGAEPAAGLPAFFAFCTQPYSVCLGIPMRAVTSTTVKPRSSTCFTASALNSSVYRLLLMNTSAVAMNYGLRVSTKGWAVQGKSAVGVEPAGRSLAWAGVAVAGVHVAGRSAGDGRGAGAGGAGGDRPCRLPGHDQGACDRQRSYCVQ